MERIRHFVLNDDRPIAPPCLLQKTPGGAFANVTALSLDPSLSAQMRARGPGSTNPRGAP
jgi:hypothetical protein